MSEIIQQRSFIKVCVRNKISSAETLRMLQKAFGEQAISKTRLYEWYNFFKDGREGVEDSARPGRPSTSTDEKHVNKIKELMLQHGRLSIRQLSKMIGISIGSVNTILKDHLGVKGKYRLVKDDDDIGNGNKRAAENNCKIVTPQVPLLRTRKRKQEILKKQKPARSPKLSVNSKHSRQKKQKSTQQNVKHAAHKTQKAKIK